VQVLPGSEECWWGERGAREQEEEMTQTMYAYVNKLINFLKKVINAKKTNGMLIGIMHAWQAQGCKFTLSIQKIRLIEGQISLKYNICLDN
jgi:hypothetical protein